jgi:hypothetical protein
MLLLLSSPTMVAIIDSPIHLVDSGEGIECCWIERRVAPNNAVKCVEEREIHCERHDEDEPERETISLSTKRSSLSRFNSQSFRLERQKTNVIQRSLSVGTIEKGKLNELSITPINLEEFVGCILDHEEDPWNYAKSGDLQALRSCKYVVDWTREDEFNSPPLYYACHSGAAVNLEVVRFLLQMYPTRLPPDLFDRCRKNAINSNVVKLLEAAQANANLSQVELQPEKENRDEYFGFMLYDEDCDY